MMLLESYQPAWRLLLRALAFLHVLLQVPALLSAVTPPCRIEVVEADSGWPVPLVELRTLHEVRFVSDNAGIIAFDLPELMGVETWFHVKGHGYEVPADGFGYQGVRLTPQPGQTLRVEVRRQSLARRLGRLTGGGLFGESQRLGDMQDWSEPGVLGCDSVLNALHRGRLFWIWGDTTLPQYPLGLFHASAATTAPQPLASFTPPVRLPVDHFRDEKGRPRNVAQMPGNGPTWLTGLVSLPDRNGTTHLVASYVKIKPPLEVYRQGLCRWNEDLENFELVALLWNKSKRSPSPPPMPRGHPVRWKDPQGQSWLLFGDPLPTLRCPPTFEAWQDTNTWEVLAPQESFASTDGEGPIRPHRGAIAWNEFRRRWVTVFVREGGETSYLGEIYYAEARDPLGPWGPAIQVLQHDNYTFYNPVLHPNFTPDGSPILLFEATYSRTFADRPRPTPRYDYNQMLYRLDLDDPGLAKAHVE